MTNVRVDLYPSSVLSDPARDTSSGSPQLPAVHQYLATLPLPAGLDEGVTRAAWGRLRVTGDGHVSAHVENRLFFCLHGRWS